MATRGRPTTSRAERRASVRESLLRAVTDLLSGGPSYTDLSINAIVAEAGLAKSTFYQYFTGKNDLLRSLVEQVIEDSGPAIGWLTAEGPVTPGMLARALHERIATHRPYLPLIAAAFDAAHFDADLREPVEHLIQLLNASTEQHLREAQDGGWVDRTLPSHETAVWLNWMLIRGVHKLVLGADDSRTETLIATYAQLAWMVLYAFAADNGLRSG